MITVPNITDLQRRALAHGAELEIEGRRFNTSRAAVTAPAPAPAPAAAIAADPAPPDPMAAEAPEREERGEMVALADVERMLADQASSFERRMLETISSMHTTMSMQWNEVHADIAYDAAGAITKFVLRKTA